MPWRTEADPSVPARSAASVHSVAPLNLIVRGISVPVSLGSTAWRLGLRLARLVPPLREVEENRHHQEYEWELHDEPRDDGDRQWLLHLRPLPEGEGERQQRQDGGNRRHGDRPHAVLAGADE